MSKLPYTAMKNGGRFFVPAPAKVLRVLTASAAIIPSGMVSSAASTLVFL